MLFASFPYLLILLPLAVLGAIALRKLGGPRSSQAWVLVVSLFFYARSRPFNLVYLFASILSNWLLARWIERTPTPAKKRILIFALAANVVFLCVFKYAGYVVSALDAMGSGGMTLHSPSFPLGLSFFTITQIMYLVDCYEETLKAGTLFDHATFVAFFPYVISGPLGRAKRMRHQFGRFGGEDGTRVELIARGLYLFAIGLFKKVVFADSFAQVAVYGAGLKHVSGLEGWVFAVAALMQLYFDFSGYSDMAIGSALMLGIEIPRNFDRPFSAQSITEFWQRWHISLTNFITTYLFTPMFKSFKRRTVWTSILSTFIAMGIAGAWHGAGMHFLLWGLMHGVALGTNQYWRKVKTFEIPAFACWALTFGFLVPAQLFWNNDSIAEAGRRVGIMVDPRHFFSTTNLYSPFLQVDGLGFRIIALPLLAACLISIFGASSEELAREFKPTPLNCAYAAGFLLVGLLLMNSSIAVPFVYFKF